MHLKYSAIIINGKLGGNALVAMPRKTSTNSNSWHGTCYNTCSTILISLENVSYEENKDKLYYIDLLIVSLI